MHFLNKSRRRMFYVYCPMCGKLLDKSEKEENVRRCVKCKSVLRVSLNPGILMMRFDSKLLRSPEFDGDPVHDRRARTPAASLL